MASIVARGHQVPFLLPLGSQGFVHVSAHLLHVHFGFFPSSIIIEEEVRCDYGVVKESILQARCSDHEGFYWLLPAGRYRIYGLSMELFPASNETLMPIFDKSIGGCPLLRPVKVESLGSGCSENTILFNVNNVKRKSLQPVIELSSDFEGATPITVCQPPSLNVVLPCPVDSSIPTTSRTTLCSLASSAFSRPPLPPNHHDSLSVLQCLCKLSLVLGSRNKLVQIDFDAIKYQKVQFLPARFNGDVLFELPPCRGSTSRARGMEGMDKRYDGHAWCRTMMSNIHNDLGLKFRKLHCIGHLICENTKCDYRTRASKSNETEWIGTTRHPFSLGQIPPPDSTVLYKVCRQTPTCLIYYVLRNGDSSRACIRLLTDSVESLLKQSPS